MVKIPSLDDLKKTGAGYLEQAKSGGITGMVDKLKTSMDNVAAKRIAGSLPPNDSALKEQIQALQTAMAELLQGQAMQAAAARKIEVYLDTLAKGLELIAEQAATQAAEQAATQARAEAKTATPTETKKPEEKKNL